jgi:hypothetical protein
MHRVDRLRVGGSGCKLGDRVSGYRDRFLARIVGRDHIPPRHDMYV